MRRFLAATILGFAFFGSAASVATACPMCKYANEAEQPDEVANLRPKAFMYSILFMLSMPPTIFTIFGVSFYRMSKRAAVEEQTTEAL